MKFYTRIILSILVLFFSFNAAAQSTGKKNSDPYESVFLLAQKFDNAGSIKEAFVEYKRYLFLQDYGQGIHQEEACLALSRLYENESKYTKALEYLYLAQGYNPGTALQLEEIRLLRKFSAEKTIDLESNVNLFRYRFAEGYDSKVKLLAWVAVIENDVQREDFELLETNLLAFYQEFPQAFESEDKETIATSIEKLKKFKPKSPMLAMHLSFIPGLGQLYAGQPLDALNAFVLNGALIGLSTWTLITQNYLDFALFEFNPTIRFYRGNLYNAQKEVYEYNDQKRKTLKTPIIETLNDVYKNE